MKAPDKIYVEVCEDGIFAFPEPPFKESVEYIRADLNKQPVEGLEEAASRGGFDYVDDIVQETPGHRWNDHDVEFGYRDGFIAGAEWQKKLDDLETADLLAIAHLQGMEQQKYKMLEDAVEGEVAKVFPEGEASIHYNPGFGIGKLAYFCKADGLAEGDKVKIIIVKEN